MRKILILFLLVVQNTIFSCLTGNATKVLELRIINSELHSYSTDLSMTSIGQISLIKDKKVQKLKYSITNLSDKNVVFIPNSNIESITRARLKIKKNLDLYNLLIKDSVGNRLRVEIEQISFVDNFKEDNGIDSSLIQFYKYLGYDERFALTNQHLLNNYTMIPKNSTVYFENWLFLPFEDVNVRRTPFYSYPLFKDNRYVLSLEMKADTTEINRYLTKSQLKTIKENNYKIYHGVLESVNSVPIKFIE